MANEKRMIDAIAYCKELILERDYPNRSDEFIGAIEVAIADLGDMPTIDAVEVVRCEKCIHGIDDGWICGGLAMMPCHPTFPDCYCNYGERKIND